MIRRAAVVVPAANEEALIDSCLIALRAAIAAAPWPVRVIVVLDTCIDGTAERIRHHPGVETVVTAVRNVGEARRLGALHALLGGEPNELWLASTDADSAVPVDWLSRMGRLACDVDLVVGTVVPDTGLPALIEQDWFARHRLRDGHPHVHAANLGIRGDAYLALGGWRPLCTREDTDLVERAVEAGLRISRDASIPVRTSPRVTGRAPEGFSSYLRALGHT